MLTPMRLLPALLLITGCRERLCAEVAELPNPGDVLAIGDSIQAWGRAQCQSVDEHIGLARGAAITSHAVNGTRMLDGEDRIPDQYTPGAWDWVIVDGGGNDVNTTCGCGDCAAVLDQIVTQDGLSGEMPALVDRIQGDGARVALLLYYELGPDPSYGFHRCPETLDVLAERYTALAASRPELLLLDLGQVMDPLSTPQHYDFDDVHPSPSGAAALGGWIADLLAQQP